MQVVLVAFKIDEDNMRHAQELLMMLLPNPTSYNSVIGSWWIAEDERYDKSDKDSAVFVNPGCQEKARKMLKANGMGQ